jgi:hypothetical protein
VAAVSKTNLKGPRLLTLTSAMGRPAAAAGAVREAPQKARPNAPTDCARNRRLADWIFSIITFIARSWPAFPEKYAYPL